MSRFRASAVYAALVTMVATMAMVVGAVTFTSTAASATPRRPYPPPPASLVVNRGHVNQNSNVRVTGLRYANRERVYVTITYPAQPRRRPVSRTVVVYANRSGNFSLNVRLTGTGRVVIQARGANSRKSASAVVVVSQPRGRDRGNGRNFRAAAFVAGVDTPGPTGPTPNSPASSPIDRGLPIAGLGVLALLGGAVITNQVARRRRKVHA